jgi:hypothetical protein
MTLTFEVAVKDRRSLTERCDTRVAGLIESFPAQMAVPEDSGSPLFLKCWKEVDLGS